MMTMMQMDYNMDFLKRDSLNVFQIFKFGSEIFEIMQKLNVVAIQNFFKT